MKAALSIVFVVCVGCSQRDSIPLKPIHMRFWDGDKVYEYDFQANKETVVYDRTKAEATQ